MSKEREIIIELINNKNINNRMLIEFFVKKYCEKYIKHKS